MLRLRGYQELLKEEAKAALGQGCRILMILPPGGGKTAVFASIAKEFYDEGRVVWVISRCLHLIRQLDESLKLLTGIKVRPMHHEVAITQGGIYLATTQYVGKHYRSWGKPDLIIVDEAHHCASQVYQEIFKYFSSVKVLGVSGTPYRGENSKLIGRVFEKAIIGPTMRELINKGFLCDYQIISSNEPTYYHLASLKEREEGHTESLNKELTKILESYRRYANQEACIIFAPTISSCQIISDFFQRHGVASDYIEGENESAYTKIITRFKQGEIKVIVNCELLIQGIDLPMAKAAIILKPTESLEQWIQMCGRVLRPWQHKSLAIILDHTDNYSRHGAPCDDRNWVITTPQSTPYPKKIQKASQERRRLIRITEHSLKTLSSILNNLDEDDQSTENHHTTIPKNSEKKHQNTTKHKPDTKPTENLSETIQFLKKLESSAKDNIKNISISAKNQEERREKWEIMPENRIKELEVYKMYEQHGIKKVIDILSEQRCITDWRGLWSFLVYVREKKEYHQKWLVHTCYKLRSPLEVWEQLAIYLDYQPGWAYHCWRECQQGE